MDLKQFASKVKDRPNNPEASNSESMPEYVCKDTVYFQNPIRQSIYNLLLTGNPYSVAELSSKLRIPDPRSHLRYIKKSGVPLKSCWLQGKANKYKVYFISGEATTSPLGKEA